MAPLLGTALSAMIAACSPVHGERGAATAHTANTSAVASNSKAGVQLPRRVLLAPPKEPNCEFHGQSGQAGADADAVLRMKLDYERQCYRHAEMIARNRLRQLQTSVDDTIKGGKRRDGSDR
jgi:hypothetical protein